MELITWLISFIMHIDKHLVEIIKQYGALTYLIMFLIIFCETGLVVAPLLPGDSLIFALGALSAGGELDIVLISWVLVVAAILGDTVNYHIGKFVGPKVFSQEHNRFFKKEHLMKTHVFYEKHGAITIIIARFIPIIRTFAPFVAGIGVMSYSRFIIYNVGGAIMWVILFLAGGYYFGNLPMVRKNFTLVIMAIIIISVIPILIEGFKVWRQGKQRLRADL
jgi:membrane-associated protein